MSVEGVDDPTTVLGGALVALWDRAVAGDRDAFAAFYLRHANAVYSHCRVGLGDQRDAEDATAEVFARAWQFRSRVYFHEQADVLPWLLVTSNHVMRRHYRTVGRARRLARDLPPPQDVPDFAEELVERDATARSAQLALAVLRELKPEDREIIELAVIQQISPSAVAGARNIPAGTVRARLSRALSRARRQYDQLAAQSDDSQDGELT